MSVNIGTSGDICADSAGIVERYVRLVLIGPIATLT